ncbi:MAG: hypothetical protein H7332_03590 [Bdellovibrionales bacterium]|nr:hypothetical protein [Ramlibacter sp.]
MASNSSTKNISLIDRPAANMTSGPHRSREYKNGDRGDAPGMNLAHDRSAGAPRRSVRAQDVGQVADAAAETQRS